MIFLLLLIISETPGLDVPDVFIYGRRERREVVKGTLLQDRVCHIREISSIIPRVGRLRARERVHKKRYTTRLRLGLGPYPMVGVYGGLDRYSFSVLYDKNSIREGIELNVGLPYISARYENITFEGGDLHTRRYERGEMRFSFGRDALSIDGGVAISSGNTLITLDGEYAPQILEVATRMRIYSGGDFIIPFSIAVPLSLNNFSISPGLFFSISNRKSLRRVYPGISVRGLFSPFTVSLSYTPYATILDEGELMVVNPFTHPTLYRIDTGDRFEFIMDSQYGFIKAGYQENYPVFYYDTSWYSIGNSSLFFLKGYGEVGIFTIEAEYRHGLSDVMPHFTLSPGVVLGWDRFRCSLSSSAIFRKDPGNYLTLNILLSYKVSHWLSIISRIDIPSGNTEPWKGSEEERTRVYLGIRGQM